MSSSSVTTVSADTVVNTSDNSQINITVNPSQGMNEQQLAQLMAYQLERLHHDKQTRQLAQFTDAMPAY